MGRYGGLHETLHCSDAHPSPAADCVGGRGLNPSHGGGFAGSSGTGVSGHSCWAGNPCHRVRLGAAAPEPGEVRSRSACRKNSRGAEESLAPDRDEKLLLLSGCSKRSRCKAARKRGVRRTWMYVATTSDEANAADGPFSAAY